MLRSSRRRHTPLYAVALAAFLVASVALPASAGHPDKGGKKPIGEIASFDGTTLTVTMNDESSVAAPVAEDVKVKITHRGHKEHGKGHSKPSNGTLEDLVAGAQVLRMKTEDGVVTKLRLRPAPAEVAESEAPGTEEEVVEEAPPVDENVVDEVTEEAPPVV